ncbi:hypothetical protein [Candidatus Methylomicrobium oryzae]|uniref:hypothetical protein n=1 Tax=Candidatus Methylomicrobium oryzae TaxID=2802053 RepID=UPI00192261CD|nr:hypothetical protein [Methylomicrobium sp. RS1]MBL1265811.1 hypothetical protein [Methylomicrobium sp. RS1]
MNKIKYLTACFLVPVLSGCTFIRAVTFVSDDNSFKREGSKVNLTLFSKHDNNNPCEPKPIFETEFVPPLLAGAAVAIAMNIAESEISSYLDKKQKEFTANYGANANYIYNIKDPMNCIKITRTISPKNTNDDPPIAFEWVAGLEETSTNTEIKALSLKPKWMILNKAAARTDSSSKKVDVSIEIKIDVTAENEKKSVVTSNFADKFINYSGSVIGYICAQKEKCPESTSWFPAIPNGAFVNISAVITEVGSGGESFGTLGKQIDDNKKTLNDAVAKVITDTLTPPASSKK